MIETVRLQDFRCFSGVQEARLAPLTLLVGANSTGKTSFLAMFRAIWKVAYGHSVPDFKEEPFDLGSFDDMLHHGVDSQAHSFAAGFTERTRFDSGRKYEPIAFDVTFERSRTAPIPVERRISDRDQNYVKIREQRSEDPRRSKVYFEVCVGKEKWDTKFDVGGLDEESLIPGFFFIEHELRKSDERLSSEARKKLHKLIRFTYDPLRMANQPPYASAPVRSRPKRTYDPKRPARDPEGDYIPAYLAEMKRLGGKDWTKLKKRLEEFGVSSGLFKSLTVQLKGKIPGDPFQIQVRHTKGDPWRNLMDMGYGVNQVLPLVTELSRPDALPTSLLQQPEVHLHPSAQAALGTLFCHLADEEHQLIVETHSDHLINRIRMDIRDRTTGLKSDDVSVLYFEQNEEGVSIHSLEIDTHGNMDAPESYGRFFMDEINREIKL